MITLWATNVVHSERYGGNNMNDNTIIENVKKRVKPYLQIRYQYKRQEQQKNIL